MAFTKSHRNPAQLTAQARAAFRAHVESFATATMFPLLASPTLHFNVNIGDSVLPAAARFRSLNTESEVGTLEGGQAASGKLPPISIRIPVDEYQTLVMYGDTEAIGAAFDERARRTAQAVGSRFVLAQVEALVTGKVTLNERNLRQEVDFGRPATHSATAATLWTATGADPIADLEGLRQVMNKGITTLGIPRGVMSTLQANEEIIKIVVGRGSDLPSRVSEADVRSVLRDYGFGEVTVNEQTIVDTSGAEVPLFPQDRVILNSGSQFGETLLGVTAESINPENGISRAEAPGLFSGATHTHDPEGYNVLVSGLGLPVLRAPLNTGVLKVK